MDVFYKYIDFQMFMVKPLLFHTSLKGECGTHWYHWVVSLIVPHPQLVFHYHRHTLLFNCHMISFILAAELKYVEHHSSLEHFMYTYECTYIGLYTIPVRMPRGVNTNN